MADLFLLTDLAPLVGGSFDTDLATAARDVATGVVLAVCHLTAVPDVPPLGMVAVAKRAAARFYANPTDMRAEGVGGYTGTYAVALLDEADLLVLELVAAQLASSGRAKSVTLCY